MALATIGRISGAGIGFQEVSLSTGPVRVHCVRPRVNGCSGKDCEQDAFTRTGRLLLGANQSGMLQTC